MSTIIYFACIVLFIIALIFFSKKGGKNSLTLTNQDTIPGRYGKFGIEASNPIPIRGIYNIPKYLNQLRYKDVSKEGNVIYYPVSFQRTSGFDNSEIGSRMPESPPIASSINVDNIVEPVDIYNLYTYDGSRKLAKVYIHAYHLKTSKMVPKGFVLDSDVHQIRMGT